MSLEKDTGLKCYYCGDVFDKEDYQEYDMCPACFQEELDMKYWDYYIEWDE